MTAEAFDRRTFLGASGRSPFTQLLGGGASEWAEMLVSRSSPYFSTSVPGPGRLALVRRVGAEAGIVVLMGWSKALRISWNLHPLSAQRHKRHKVICSEGGDSPPPPPRDSGFRPYQRPPRVTVPALAWSADSKDGADREDGVRYSGWAERERLGYRGVACTFDSVSGCCRA